MKVPIWLLDLFPFLFPKTKKSVRIKIQGTLEERWKIVSKRLHAEDIPLPQLSVIEPLEYSHHKGLVTISYSSVKMEENELVETIDHELTHHIQFIKNPKAYPTASFDLFCGTYWFLKGKLNTALAKKAFREGFATYVAYLTSGRLNTSPKDIHAIKERKFLKVLVLNERLPYILGYLAYSAIAEFESEEKALLCGLSDDFALWLSKSRNAIAKLGKPYPI